MRSISNRLISKLTGAMILLGVALVTTTHAQLEVMINEPQGEFVAHERISVGFSVTNRSGRDIVLAAPDGQV